LALSAADFSITEFSYLTQLLLWHGTSWLNIVIHRGLIISVMQAVFSAFLYFAPIALYQGYGLLCEMAPAFSLVLDRDDRGHVTDIQCKPDITVAFGETTILAMYPTRR